MIYYEMKWGYLVFRQSQLVFWPHSSSPHAPADGSASRRHHLATKITMGPCNPNQIYMLHIIQFISGSHHFLINWGHPELFDCDRGNNLG